MQCDFLFLLFLLLQRVVSSVGLEHYLDRVGVTGSTPVQPTLKIKTLQRCEVFFFLECALHIINRVTLEFKSIFFKLTL